MFFTCEECCYALNQSVVLFRVNPVFGVIEPGKSVEVTVTHNKGPAKEGKLVIVNSVVG